MDDVEAVIRAYFSELATSGEPQRYATGTLAAADEIVVAAQRTVWRGRFELHSVEVQHVDGDAAVASVSGRIVRELEELSHKTDVTGPAQLARVDGEWRVVSFTRNGRISAPRILDLPETWIGDVALRPRVVDLQAHSTRVVLEARNEASEPAQFEGVKLRDPFVIARRRIKRGLLGGIVPPRQTVLREALMPPVPADVQRLRFRVSMTERGLPAHADFWLEL